MRTRYAASGFRPGGQSFQVDRLTVLVASNLKPGPESSLPTDPSDCRRLPTVAELDSNCFGRPAFAFRRLDSLKS